MKRLNITLNASPMRLGTFTDEQMDDFNDKLTKFITEDINNYSNPMDAILFICLKPIQGEKVNLVITPRNLSSWWFEEVDEWKGEDPKRHTS
jgi:hypothetical protein